jgi:hypothetical protein
VEDAILVVVLFWLPESLVEVAPAVPVEILVLLDAPFTEFPDGIRVDDPPEVLPFFWVFMP